jgi:serine/threonine protein kinase
MPSRLGALAGRYILTRLLGEDEAVSTFEGLDSQQDWPVLIKLLPKALSDDPVRQQKLERLVERLTALDHPNILSIVEAGLEEGVPYLIAQGIAATPLADKLGQTWDVDQVARIMAQAGEALTHAYRQGVIHGRLTPQNLLLAAGDRVLLSDLGLESVLETPWEQVQEALTPYLAPERIRGWLPDARADIYALGAILFEMLTGLQLDGPPEQAFPWLHEIVPELAPDLEPVLARALATDPEARYATVGEFMADLQPILSRHVRPQETPSPAEPASLPTPESPEAPAPQPAPAPTLITPALEGIPAIPMPEPPPVPTFDWEAFGWDQTPVPLPEPPPPPEPPPFPEITPEGIELPSVTPVVYEVPDWLSVSEGPEETPSLPPRQPRKAQTPAQDSARPVRRARPPATPSAPPARLAAEPEKPKPPFQLSPEALARLRRPARAILIVTVILLLLTSLCCCWLLFTSDIGDLENTPASYHRPLDLPGVLSSTFSKADLQYHEAFGGG